MKINKMTSLRISAFIAGALSLFTITDLSAHGYVSSPQSRILVCHKDSKDTAGIPTLPACIAANDANVGGYAFYSPQEVAVYEAKGDHQQWIPDGKLCSANRPMFAGLDLARNDWTATTVAPGPREFVWTHTASHRTTYFRYYITKQGFDPASAPLKWSDLELIHDSGPEPQQITSTHLVNLPQRSGKHIVYAIWQRDWVTDAPEANYQCIDVDFQPMPSSSSVSSSSSSSSVVDNCSTLPYWNSTTVYVGGNQVQHNGKRYRANYWTQGNNPVQSSGQYNHWLDLGSCTVTSSASSSSVSSSRSSSSLSSSSRSSTSSRPLGCNSPTYSGSYTYKNGDLVQNFGYEYCCTVSGWCNTGGPYVPGVGWAWANAWVQVRGCAIE